MSSLDQYIESSVIHPIDIVETLAETNAWDFDRVADDQIAMAIEGAWRTYSITLAWSGRDETLRLICSFEMEPPTERLAELYELLNLANENCWSGAFAFWKKHGLMAYRYGLCLRGGEIAGRVQIDHLVQSAVAACERYYPAIQLVCWGDDSANSAMDIAIGETFGTA